MKEEILTIPEAARLIVSVEPITVRPEEAAKLLGIGKNKVYELVARDDFNGVIKLGKCTLLSVEALREWVRNQCGAGGD